MKDLIVKTYKKEDFYKWNEFLIHSKNGTFLFHRDFMEYHEDRFKDASLMVFKNDKLISLFPANKFDNNIYSHQGLTYGGIIVKKDTRTTTAKEIFDSIILHLKKQGFLKLFYKDIPSFYCNQSNDEFKYLLLQYDAKIYRTDLFSVTDLKKKNSFKSGRKRGIKNAIANNLQFIEVPTMKLFWNEILIPNLENKYNVSPVHTLDEIEKLKEKFPQQIRQFNIYDNETIVAGTTVFEMNEVIHAQYISTNHREKELGSIDFLFYKLITEVYKDKKVFSFGISNENQGKLINEGLNFWKESFSAANQIQLFFELDLSKITEAKSIFV